MKIFYLCNKKKCEYGSCRFEEPLCSHTTDKNYALHKDEMGKFIRLGKDLWEVDGN